MAFDDELKKTKQVSTVKYRQIGISLLVILVLLGVILIVIQWFSSMHETNETVGLDDNLLAVEESNQAREKFKSELIAFEKEITPFLNNSGLKAWAPERIKEISDLKTQALSHFANGLFLKAIQHLGLGTQRTQDLVAQWDTAFNQLLDKAREHFNQSDVKRAQLNVTRAIKLKPDDMTARDLSKRIEVLPEVEQLLEKVNIARVENNQQEEARLLKAIKKLDPQRRDEIKRLRIVEEALRELRFTSNIKSAISNIDNGNIKAAHGMLKQAASIYPDRSELTLVREKISKAVASANLETLLSKVDVLINDDNWQGVRDLIQTLPAQYSNHSKVQQALSLAENIISLDRKVDGYLASPRRLTDLNIKQQAVELINNNAMIAQKSFRLLNKLLKLENQLKILSKPVTVTVHSDGKTEIVVVGQGHVGKTKLRQIQLKPGVYVIEGSRKGYRSKRVNLLIDSEIINQEITIICNERI